MARARWIAPWKDSDRRPAIYHVISRVVDRRMALGATEKDKFRALMRLTERFTGCRVLAYCLMSNHFHILLEVPPMPSGGLSEGEFLRRLGALYPRWKIDEIRQRLREAEERGIAGEAERVLAGHTYRMHDLSEFMKCLLQRFSSWFNRTHGRTGRLWEQRFKSVLVEDGLAARTMAAYIDLNPVRAGICEDPAGYRWSSYAEAVSGGAKARSGLVRALQWREGTGGEPKDGARAWAQGGIGRRYRTLLEFVEPGIPVESRNSAPPLQEGPEPTVASGGGGPAAEPGQDQPDLGPSISRAVRCRIRHFTDGAVIGSRDYVDEVFRESRRFFGPGRKSGARQPRGALEALRGRIWSARDLRLRIG